MSYNEHHTALVDALRKIGIWFDYKMRIDLAWLRYNVTKVTDQTDEVRAVINHIDHCVYSRMRGLEPAHSDGWYI